MVDILHRTQEFLRDPKKKRGGFAGFFAAVSERQGKAQGKVFNKVTNKFESPTAKAKLAATKPPKQRRATILSNVSAKEADSASVKRRRGSRRSASLLRPRDDKNLLG